MTALESGLQEVTRSHPEWEPWLCVVQAVLNEADDPKWEALVPSCAETCSKAPRLAAAQINLANGLIEPLLAKLLEVASRGQTKEMATLAAATDSKLNHLLLFKAALQQKTEQLAEIAQSIGADSASFQAVTGLLPMPFLQACNRRWKKSLSVDWTDGYCPVCGAWPSFAEVRGIERSRYLRCGRCGGEWQMHCLSCPYCGITDHNQLVSLIPETTASNCVIDACKRCLGYVKSFTKLQGSPPAKVVLDDLASVEFDVAAAEQGYHRPQGTGFFLDVTISEYAAA